MPSVDLNWWAIIAATLVNMIVGSVWYSPMLFAKEWSKLAGRKMEDMQGDKMAYAYAAAGALVQSVILAHFIIYTAFFYPSYSDVTVGLLTAAWAWLGFVAITQGVNTLFAGSRKKLWVINTGYFLVVLLINGVILAVWR